MDMKLVQRALNFQTELSEAKARGTIFLQHVHGATQDTRLGAPLQAVVESNSLAFDYADHRVSATGRPIFVDGHGGCIEYVFEATVADEKIEVFRLYLNDASDLFTSLAPGVKPLCSATNSYSANHVRLALIGAMIESSLFAPRA